MLARVVRCGADPRVWSLVSPAMSVAALYMAALWSRFSHHGSSFPVGLPVGLALSLAASLLAAAALRRTSGVWLFVWCWGGGLLSGWPMYLLIWSQAT